MIKQIYFDFGGVLITYKNVFRSVCRDFGLDFGQFWEFYTIYDDEMGIGRVTTKEFWGKCIERFGLKNAENFDLAKAWVSDYEMIWPIQKLIKELEGKVDIGIISNVASGIWEKAVESGMVPNVKYGPVYLSGDLKIMKPDRRIYELVLQKSEVRPEEILFVDDLEKNLEIPQQMGWKTICFDQLIPEKGIEEIKKKLSKW